MGNRSYTYFSSKIPTMKDTWNSMKNNIELLEEYKYSYSMLTLLLCGSKFIQFSPSTSMDGAVTIENKPIPHKFNEYICSISDSKEGIKLAKRVYKILMENKLYTNERSFNTTFNYLEKHQGKYKYILFDYTDVGFMSGSEPNIVNNETKEVIKDMIDKCNHIKKLPDSDIIKYVSNNFHEDEINLMVY